MWGSRLDSVARTPYIIQSTNRSKQVIDNDDYVRMGNLVLTKCNQAAIQEHLMTNNAE